MAHRSVFDAHRIRRICKLLARIDYHLVPFLIVLYLLAFLDRVNVANARTFGLEKDLGLQGTQFNTALTIFFVPYVIFEIPSNTLLKRFSPRIWLSVCCIGFGITTVRQGLTQNFGGIVATRFFLGLFETSMFPSCFYLLDVVSSLGIAHTLYPLLRVHQLGRGVQRPAGLRDWQDGLRAGLSWLALDLHPGRNFYCPHGHRVPLYVPCLPGGVKKWVTEEERAYIRARLEADQGPNGADIRVSFRDVLTVLKDYKIWLGGFMYFGLVVPAYGYAYFSDDYPDV